MSKKTDFFQAYIFHIVNDLNRILIFIDSFQKDQFEKATISVPLHILITGIQKP